MSAITQAPAAVKTARRARGIPGLRGTGVLGHVAAAIIAVGVLMAVFGAALAPYDPNHVDLSMAYVGPTGGHLLGFDSSGRDLLSRILVGARSALLGAFIVIACSMIMGVLLAVVAAWRGGWVDSSSSVGLDVLFAFPALLLAVLAVAVFGMSLYSAAFALAIAYTPYVARILRGVALRERAQAYIAALEVQGLSGTAIVLRHLIPNILPLIVAQGTLLFGFAMVDLAAISFIGIGVQPPQADWGLMVGTGKPAITAGYPAESLSAGICIILMVVAFNVLGERLAARTPQGRP